MIPNINLGPPLAGLPTSKSPQERNLKDAGSESFGKSLEQKMGSKDGPKEMSAQKPPGREDPKIAPKPPAEVRASKSRTDTDKAEDPQERKDPKLLAEKGKPGDKVKATDREKAIKKFMDSFESEFGVPPTRLVEAIANLDETDQLKSPEETVDAVVDQLGLDDSEQDRARAMYAALLVTLSQTPPPVDKPVIVAGASQNFGQEFRQRVQSASDQKMMTNMGVDRLNQKFWMKSGGDKLAGGQGSLNAMANPSPQALSRMMLDDSLNPDAMGADQAMDIQDLSSRAEVPPSGKGPLELPPHLRGQLEQNATPAMIAALAAKIAQLKALQGSQAPAADPNALPTEDGDVSEEAVAGKTGFESMLKKPETQVSGGLGALISGSAGDASSGQASAQSHSGQSGESQDSFAKNLSGQKENLKAEGKEQSKTDFKQTMKGLEGMNAQAMPKDALPRTEAALAGGAVVGQQVLKGEDSTNIRQLMNQAQYLIKKGGGEMKVEMTPEGMGPVQLKVMVQDGKVNVQMSASTDEAKKTIETSLAELKTSLAAHKLSVDHVKVDVVNNTSTDTATNNQQQQGADARNQGRENTQKFWTQFNENFGSNSQRDSFLDVTNLKGYSQPSKDPLKPVEVASKTRAMSGKGRELNLVA